MAIFIHFRFACYFHFFEIRQFCCCFLLLKLTPPHCVYSRDVHVHVCWFSLYVVFIWLQAATKQSKKRSAKKRSRSAKATLPLSSSTGEIRVTTTIKTKPGSSARGAATSAELDPNSKAQNSLRLLKDLKKIQTTLRKDDISWET